MPAIPRMVRFCALALLTGDLWPMSANDWRGL